MRRKSVRTQHQDQEETNGMRSADDEFEDFLERHVLFMPPWRERLHADRLGPWYGPHTEAAFERALRSHRESTAGGGLWDPEEERDMSPALATREANAIAERYDAAKMRAFVERHNDQIPIRELEVYFAFYRDRLSKGDTARRMGVSKGTVKCLLVRLRRRSKESGRKGDGR